jgi:2-dehydropantoate 2-reductase
VRICVYGAGAIGGHAAAQLIDAGTSEVSLVARGEHLRAIAEHGLVLRTDGREIVAHPEAATDDPATLPAQDLVVVTLKAPALPAHASRISGLLQPDGVALFITNGIPWWWNHGLRGGPLPLLDPNGTLWTELGADRSLGGVVHCTNEIVEPGVVLHRARNRWIVGEPDGSDTPRLVRVLALLRETRLGVEHAADIRRAVWEKLVQNVAVSGISALARLQTQDVVRDHALRRMVVALVDETLAVALALGWYLRREVDAVETARSLDVPGVTPSMLQDVLQGRPLEVEAIAGQVQAFGRAAAVTTPVLDVLVPLLRGLSRSEA